MTECPRVDSVKAMQLENMGENKRSPFFLLRPVPNKHSPGFTLIELSVVLVIIGILVSLGAGALGPLTKRAKFAETRETVKTAKEAIINYAVSRHELPCDGTETCSNGDARFATLANSTDAMRGALFYIYSGNLRLNGTTNLDMCLPLLSTTNITLRICHNADCSTYDTVQNVAFFVGSRGLNLNKQVSGNGNQGANSIVRVYDGGLPNAQDQDTSDFNRTEDFDDIYAYVTLSELQAKIPCAACTAYEIYNSGPAADFRNNLTGTCYVNVAANAFVTSIGPGSSVERHGAGTSCTAYARTHLFPAALAADADRNCQVSSSITPPYLSDR